MLSQTAAVSLDGIDWRNPPPTGKLLLSPQPPAASGANAGGGPRPLLFWDAPPWHAGVRIERADKVAASIARHGVALTSLRCRFPEKSAFFGQPHLLRILPYGNERFGITLDDYDGLTAIELKLTAARRGDGQYGYDAETLSPLGIETDDGITAAFDLPPESRTIDDLGETIEHLRHLAGPTPIILANVLASTVTAVLGNLLRSDIDGIILRWDLSLADPLPLAVLVRRLRTQMDQADHGRKQIWVVADDLAVDAMAKLICLGASAVSCDQWCDHFLTGQHLSEGNGSSAAMFQSSLSDAAIESEIDRTIPAHVARVRGLVAAAASRAAVPGDLATSLIVRDPDLAKRLHLTLVSFG